MDWQASLRIIVDTIPSTPTAMAGEIKPKLQLQTSGPSLNSSKKQQSYSELLS
jgi:hypothetical protein